MFDAEMDQLERVSRVGRGMGVAGLTTMLMAAGWAVALPSASASTSAQTYPNVYFHGTTRMTSFSSRTTCDSYAKWELRQVTSNTHKAQLLGETYYYGYGNRLTCYPVQSGRWSYLIAYSALTNQPLNPADKLFPRSGSYLGDAESIWGGDHYGIFSTMTACKSHFTWALNKIQALPGVKVNFSTRPCSENGPGSDTYEIDYLAASSSPALPGDRVDGGLINIIDQTGWAVPYTS